MSIRTKKLIKVIVMFFFVVWNDCGPQTKCNNEKKVEKSSLLSNQMYVSSSVYISLVDEQLENGYSALWNKNHLIYC